MNFVEIEDKPLAARVLVLLATGARDRRPISRAWLTRMTGAPIEAVDDVLTRLGREGHVDGLRLTMTGLGLAVAFDGLRVKPATRRGRAAA
jgi:hypothetical protein